MTECSIDGCTKPRCNSRGYCSNHYDKWRRHGDPTKYVKLPNGETTRYFYEVVMKAETDDCITWPYGGRGGYGSMTDGGKRHEVHIRACTITHGPRPTPHHQAAHSCGKGHLGCCNPRHLSWKTVAENQQDRKLHGTYQYGALNPSCKLTPVQVSDIRALKGKMLQREIAAIYGVSRENVSAIHRGKSWLVT